VAFVEAGGLRVRYELAGPDDAPVVVLSHSLGTDLSMWDPQVAPLAKRLRVLRYDARGHGHTTLARGPYSLEELARDVLRLLDALDVARAHFCGLSMGGLVGMWLGAHAAARVDKLVLCNTGARIGTAEIWNARIGSVTEGGMKAVASSILERWFTPGFERRAPEVVARARTLVLRTPPQGYVGACAALRDADERGDLASIAASTLVIAGSRDPATPPADGRALADGIPGARYVELEAAHLSNLEAEAAFTAELLGFLTGERGD
jgi:3-oxoadipate enol-lactonase